MCGVDVAAPGQARRRDRNGRLPSAEEMLSTFGDVLAPAELAAIRAQPDDDAMEEAFRRHWSLKEALAKAMGVGLALHLGGADSAVVPFRVLSGSRADARARAFRALRDAHPRRHPEDTLAFSDAAPGRARDGRWGRETLGHRQSRTRGGRRRRRG